MRTRFNLDENHGLNGAVASDVGALIISQILSGYHDEDGRILLKMKNEQLIGAIKWIEESEKFNVDLRTHQILRLTSDKIFKLFGQISIMS